MADLEQAFTLWKERVACVGTRKPVVVGFRAPAILQKHIQRIAHRLGTSESDAVRFLVQDSLERFGIQGDLKS